MTLTTDVVVVGAGIVGAACAYELAKQKVRVAVIDAGGVGTGATAAGMGHLVAMDDSEAQFSLTRYSQKLWQAFRQDLPPTVEYQESGTVWVAADEEEMNEVRRKHAYYRERQVPAEILDRQSLRQAEPGLSEALAGGLLVPGDAVLYPPCAARFLVEKALERGAQLLTGRPVASIGKGSAVLADGTTWSAAAVVNAAGEFSPTLTPGIDIRPRKGHLVITDRYPGKIRHQLVELGYLKSAHSSSEDSVAFNVQPRITGQLLVGSSRQYRPRDGGVEGTMVARMLHRAFEYLPDLAELSSLRAWTGFRAATPDKLPLIGPWAPDPTVLVAAGHEGLGITSSLATGRLVADHFLGRATEIPNEPYLPSRQLEPVAHG